MKVAICISGYLRTWAICRESFREKFCRDLECEPDIFIHTYKQNKYLPSKGNPQRDEMVTEEELREMFEGLPVRLVVVEDADDFKLSRKECADLASIPGFGKVVPESGDPSGKLVHAGELVYNDLRKIQLCNKLRTDYEAMTGTIYDLIVTTRFDVLYLDSPEWTKIYDHHIHTERGADAIHPHNTVIITSPESTDDVVANRFDLMKAKECETICPHIMLASTDCEKGRTFTQYWGVVMICKRSNPPLFAIPNREDMQLVPAMDRMRRNMLLDIVTPVLPEV